MPYFLFLSNKLEKLDARGIFLCVGDSPHTLNTPPPTTQKMRGNVRNATIMKKKCCVLLDVVCKCFGKWM